MTKEEIIKNLRSVSNDIKELNRNFSEEDMINEKYTIKKIEIQKTAIKLNVASIVIFTAIFIDALSRSEKVLMFMEAGLSLNALFKIKLSVDTINELVDELEKNNKDGYTKNQQIDNLERAVSFLQSLSKEEQEKYLKLRM